MIKKYFYIKTLGCKVNQYESQVIRENFLKDGYIEINNGDEADVCVINTCTVTSTSDAKSLKLIRSNLKKKNKCVVVTGCMIDAKDLDLGKLKGVDFIVKNKDKYNISYIIKETPQYHSLRLGMGQGPVSGQITGFKNHVRAFVKIQ
ncbi:MAG: tRNA (N(6)-L-threonylcarbamoyladenosine(37)-C(2))-methylthiotransferase MtaB, partial [Candidatus Omnitrophica bacterium]|nr:tRNA (N(6)-L-threonylcarbamoyladenosine(37)-C(2))-methylthiotransferase MtaB [Candidatus Omnitrophota bacterium]